MNEYFFRFFPIIILLITGNSVGYAQMAKFLIPNETIVQYAGSIGYFSLGAGYKIFKNNRGNIDFNYGYVPASKGGKLNILTTKFSYKPFEIRIKNWAKIYPFNPGIFITYTFHKNLGLSFPPDQYPKGYYFWSESVRPHLSLSNELQLNIKDLIDKSSINAISIYSEFNTNDYYLINFLENPSALSLEDIFKMGIGMRLKF
ncbi:MAG TPA: hypothetical protein VD908_08795 [Cytophagales bacterium]|nr:hypothetical protein [Cytophagales bacterium]